ncbi:XRE family transcriptional regulator [Paenibacillus sp.]|uniref:helix-turn-helix domain-containing protein n=1 Tax=Paenibacillus sp. TaxID=58172 RepID=UPI002D47220F|nr:XRE family transcriptional regulator [Paenibacillus sp.]HZG55928.1 XRE family transcriptional regulator [Paenibacillus sp.]
MELGKRIRLHRKQQKRTQDEIASRCGFTVSLLSKIENGQTTPPVATLMKIANALGLKVSDLLEPDHHASTVYNADAEKRDPERWIKTDKGYSFFAFATSRSDKAMQPYLFTARKDEVGGSLLSHEGEEFIFVLEGEMRYRVGAIEYTLRAGDSLYFNSLEEHTLAVVSDEVKYLAVFTEASANRHKA